MYARPTWRKPMSGLYVAAPQPIHRRAFLADLGRGAFAFAILGVAGCSPAALASVSPPPGQSSASGPGPSGTVAGSPTAAPPGGSSTPGAGVAWSRVNLGFVSA